MGIMDQAKAMTFVCTRDRAKAVPFYRDILGFRLTGEDRFAAVFDLNGVMMRLSAVPDWVAHEHTILGFEVDSIEDAVKALAAKGVAFNRYDGFGQDDLGIWTSPDKSARVAWFRDTDGNVLSLTQF